MKKKVLLIITLLIFVGDAKAQEVNLGTYRISSAINTSLVLIDNNSNIELGSKADNEEALWDIYSGGTYYYIKKHENNGKAIEIAGASTTNRANIRTFNVNNTNAQKWRLNYAGNESYYITNVMGNYNLDITGGLINSGINVQMYQSNGSDAQRWRLTKISVEDDNSLSDGNYIIRAANNKNNSIDLAGGETKNTSNIRMYSNNNTWAQVWSIKSKDGYYKINSLLDDNKVMDINSAYFKNCTNIHLFSSNNTIAQKFKIIKNEDNTFSIRTFDGLWAFDIFSGYTQSGTNLQLYQPNGTIAQKFYLDKVNLSDIKSGYYNIETNSDESLVIGVANKALANFKNVDIRPKTDSNYTKWYIKKIERDIYTIYNSDSKKMVLDVSGNGTNNGTNIQLYSSNNTTAQKWIIRKNDDGTYKFIGVNSGKVLDIKDGKAENAANIQLFDDNNSDGQRFKIVSTQISDYIKEYEDDQYIIKYENGNVFDIAGAVKRNGTNVRLFTPNDTKAQVWSIKYNGDGEYIISSLINPKIVLTASSNNVVSSKNENNDFQKWFFDKEKDNTYIINKATGKYLSLDGSNIILGDNRTDNKFSLSKYKKIIVYKGIDVSAHQNNINWANVASSSVDFAIIRAGFAEEYLVQNPDGTYKDKYEDSKFVKNVEECEKYNIPYALYFYSYANNVTGDDSAVQEAEHMLNLLKKITKNGNYPTLNTEIFFDQEDSTLPNNKNVLTNIVNRFCGIMNNNGHKCGLYANQNWLNNRINVQNIANNHSIWVAQWPGFNDYNSALNSKSSYTTTQHKLWQFTSNGSISGISGRVDLDIGYDIFK